jgi:hypothetical protein
MNTKHSQWYPIENTPNLHGFYAVRHSDKTRVEVVRCYQGEWTIFTYRNGQMTDECRKAVSANATFPEVKRYANRILAGESLIPRNNQQLET